MILNGMAVKIALLMCFALTMGEEPPETPSAADVAAAEDTEAGADETVAAAADPIESEAVKPNAEPDLAGDATKAENPADALVPEVTDTGVAAPIVPESGAVPCGGGDFVPPVLTPVEDAACFFAKNGWFPPGAAKLDQPELLAELTKLLAPDASALTPELGLVLLKKCYGSFKPLSLDVLDKNRGGLAADLFGGKQGYDIDLFSVSKTCHAVISSLTSVRTGGVTAPVEVVKLCISYFGNVVIDNVLGAVTSQIK